MRFSRCLESCIFLRAIHKVCLQDEPLWSGNWIYHRRDQGLPVMLWRDSHLHTGIYMLGISRWTHQRCQQQAILHSIEIACNHRGTSHSSKGLQRRRLWCWGVCSFDGQKYLVLCFARVLHQGYWNWELGCGCPEWTPKAPHTGCQFLEQDESGGYQLWKVPGEASHCFMVEYGQRLGSQHG